MNLRRNLALFVGTMKPGGLLLFFLLLGSSHSHGQGVIATVAGGGQTNSFGDGGPALAAVLNTPSSIVVDVSGSFYVSDSADNRVRKISPDGTITAVAGRGLGFDGDGGPATQALLRSPSGLALDGFGNLYIADSGNGRIRRVDRNGIISTVAGGGGSGSSNDGDGGPATAAILNYPVGVALDAGGTLYISESLAGRIRKVSPDGIISTFSSGTSLFFPRGLAVDPLGNLYISTPALSVGRRDGRVVRITPEGETTSVISGIIGPSDPAIDGTGNVYVADAFEHKVIRTDSGGKTTIAGIGEPGFSGDGGPAPTAALNNPLGVALDAAGNLYIADSGNHRIRKIFFNPASGLPEPTLKTRLQPGFYVAEVRTGEGAQEGYWGIEVLLERGNAAGTIFAGGALQSSGRPPGFCAFYLPQTEWVTIRVEAQAAFSEPGSGATVHVRLLDGLRRQLGDALAGTDSLEFAEELREGFYIVEIRGGENIGSSAFQIGVSAPFLDGGLNGGAFIDAAAVGFAAFYVSGEQEVSIRLLGQPSYGAAGAGTLRLRLFDAGRNVVRTVP